MNTQRMFTILAVLVTLFSFSASPETKAASTTQDASQACDESELVSAHWEENVTCKLVSAGTFSVQANEQESFSPETSNALEFTTSSPTVPWNIQIGGIGTEIHDVTTDTFGNVFVTGMITSVSDSDAFVAKLDSNGSVQWSYSFEGMAYDNGEGIVLDANGNIFITGGARNTSNPGTSDIFLARLSNDGSLQWKTTLGNNTQQDYGMDIALDGDGNIYITGGSFGSWGSPIRPYTSGQYDAFVAKFDPGSGNRIWNTFLGEGLNGFGLGISADSVGNLYITGMNFLPSQPSNAFVAGLNPGGSSLWYSTLGNSTAIDAGRDIALDGNGNVYVTGDSWGSWGSPINAFSGEVDAFVLKLTNGGGLQWSTFLGGTGFEMGYGIDVDAQGNVYIAGPSTDVWGNPFDSGTGSPQDVFAAKLDDTGSLQWNTFIKGEPWYQSYGHKNRLAEQNGSIYIASNIGVFETTRAFLTKINDSVYGCSPDTFEPDDTFATGSPINIGEVQRHSLCPQNDEDWVNFQVSPNLPGHRNVLVETFDLEPDDINPNGNTKIIVKDALQNQIGINLDRGLAPPSGSTQPEVKSSRVVWHSAADGVFYITIVPETPVNEQAGSGYSLRLEDPFTDVLPVDQASWGPTWVNVPFVWRSGNVIYFTQYFTYEQAELDALNNPKSTLAWEFRRPEVDTDTGKEKDKTKVDYGDYWRNVDGVCERWYFTNLPNHSDRFTEESNSIAGCPHNLLWSEEFELYVDDPTELVAGKVYYITIKFYVHDEYLNSNYQFYISKTEKCELYDGRDWLCNFADYIPSGPKKYHANLIEGYLQPAP